MKGIDISSWNDNIDLATIKKAGYDFVMIRLGYGRVVDGSAEKHIKNAKKAGLFIGGYWFLYADTPETASQNADVCLKFLNKYKETFTMPIALDFEADSIRYTRQYGGSCTSDNYTKMVCAFLEKVEDAGYYVSLYVNPSDYKKLHKDDIKRYDLWLAQWSVKKPSLDCGMWQYTSDPYDQNIAYYSYPGMIKANKLNHLTDDTKSKTKTITYVIKAGDTLSGIALKYGLDYKKIADDNNIKNPDLIYAGQKLKLKGVKA